MPKKYPILRATDYNVRAQIGAGLDDLSDRIGGPDNPDGLVPPYDGNTMRFRPVVWEAKPYYRGDVVFDPPWLMQANKDTTERAAPQPVGNPEYTLPDSLTWTPYQNTSVIYSGHLYTFTETGYLRSLRVWVPELGANTNYRFVVIRNPNSANPIYTTIEEPVLNENAWTVLTVRTILVTAGEELLVYIDALNSGSDQTWAYNWRFGGQVQNVAPVSGEWQIDQQDDLLAINWLDAEAIPVDHQLELQVVPGTIFQISEVGNPANFRHYQVQGLYSEQAGYTQYTVQIIDTGGTWPPPLQEATQIRAVQPIADPTKFVGIDAYWGPGTLPSWAGIQSFLQYDGVSQPVQGDEAYGIDISFQELVKSDDWDVVYIGDVAPADGNTGTGGGINTIGPIRFTTTTDNMWTEIDRQPIPAGRAYTGLYIFDGIRTGATEYYTAELRVLAYTGTVDDDLAYELGPALNSVRARLDGTDVVLEVRGQVGETWGWYAASLYREI